MNIGTLLTQLGIGLAMILSSLFFTGCGMSAVDGARHALAGTARVSAQMDERLAAKRLEVSQAIVADPSATREDHEAAMAVFDVALAATIEVREAHLVTQAVLDSVEHGEAKDWRPFMMCVFSSLTRLVGVATRHVDVPDDAGDVLRLLAGLAEGSCPAPEDEE